MTSRIRTHRASRTVALAAVLGCIAPHRAAAQRPTEASVGDVDVGSDRERILRVLQITGRAPLGGWEVRPLPSSFVDSVNTQGLSAEWARTLRPTVSRAVGFEWRVLPAETREVFNSAFPYGFNDGPIWAGRGITSSVSGGIAAKFGVVSLQLEPIAFVAQNSAFALRRPGDPTLSIYANEYAPGALDAPQRFGPSAYGRFDPGQSTIRADIGFVAVGASTADQFWGPAIENPLILGNNAAGIPHAFVGTSHPVNVWIGTVHGVVEWGRLDQTAYSPMVGPGAVRFMSGLAGSFTPRGAPGLEVGIARFFHDPWPAGGFFHGPFSTPFEGVLKNSLSTATNPSGDVPLDNQLASAFFRWVFPHSGFEVYGEYGREDASWNARDFWQEIDHDAAYSLGFQRAWRHDSTHYTVVRAEVLNSRLSHLEQAAAQTPWYVHFGLRQGHTELGQFLGSAGAFGGGAAVIAVERYVPDGVWTYRWGRLMRGENRQTQDLPNAMAADVLQTLGVERVRMFRAFDLTAGATAVLDLNRDFHGDVFNMNVTLGARTHW